MSLDVGALVRKGEITDNDCILCGKCDRICMEAREGGGVTRHETEPADTIARTVEKTVAEAGTVTRLKVF
jgi:ferredoxin